MKNNGAAPLGVGFLQFYTRGLRHSCVVCLGEWACEGNIGRGSDVAAPGIGKRRQRRVKGWGFGGDLKETTGFPSFVPAGSFLRPTAIRIGRGGDGFHWNHCRGGAERKLRAASLFGVVRRWLLPVISRRSRRYANEPTLSMNLITEIGFDT